MADVVSEARAVRAKLERAVERKRAAEAARARDEHARAAKERAQQTALSEQRRQLQQQHASQLGNYLTAVTALEREHAVLRAALAEHEAAATAARSGGGGGGGGKSKSGTSRRSAKVPAITDDTDNLGFSSDDENAPPLPETPGRPLRPRDPK